MCISTILMCTSCRQSDVVSYNVSKQADNFNIVRKITVFNCIQGDILFEMSGKMSISVDTEENQLEVLIEDDGNYMKHFIGLSDNVTYVIEDVNGADVNKYRYTMNINPRMWAPQIPDVEVID